MADQTPLVKGTLDALVLKALSWAPMHGFEITTWLEERSAGALEIDDSALYQALYRMEERGWIESEWGVSENSRRAKFYKLTAAGRKQLNDECANWERVSEAVTRVLRMA